MAKQLILFRHGKSDWQADFATDHERPVAKRGLKAASTMGQLLARSQQVPDRVMTSSALRAKTTAEVAHQAGDWSCPIEVSDDLYEASPEQILRVIQQATDEANTLLLVGHQPTWSELAAALIGGGTLAMPTAAMACIAFDVPTWASVQFGSGHLKWLLPPKLFTRGRFDLG